MIAALEIQVSDQKKIARLFVLGDEFGNLLIKEQRSFRCIDLYGILRKHVIYSYDAVFEYRVGFQRNPEIFCRLGVFILPQVAIADQVLDFRVLIVTQRYDLGECPVIIPLTNEPTRTDDALLAAGANQAE